MQNVFFISCALMRSASLTQRLRAEMSRSRKLVWQRTLTAASLPGASCVQRTVLAIFRVPRKSWINCDGVVWVSGVRQIRMYRGWTTEHTRGSKLGNCYGRTPTVFTSAEAISTERNRLRPLLAPPQQVDPQLFCSRLLRIPGLGLPRRHKHSERHQRVAGPCLQVPKRPAPESIARIGFMSCSRYCRSPLSQTFNGPGQSHRPLPDRRQDTRLLGRDACCPAWADLLIADKAFAPPARTDPLAADGGSGCHPPARLPAGPHLALPTSRSPSPLFCRDHGSDGDSSVQM